MNGRMIARLLILAFAAIDVSAADPCGRPLRIQRSEQTLHDRDDIFLQALFKHAGCTLETTHVAHRLPLERRFELLKAGEADVLIGVSRRPDRESFAHFSQPFRAERIVVWTRARDKTWVQGKSFDDLLTAGWKVIGPAQGWFGPRYDEINKDKRMLVASYRVLEQGVKLLLSKRGDLLVGDQDWLRNVPLEARGRLYMLPQALHEEALYLMYSKRTVSPDVVAHLDRSILALKETQPANEGATP